MLFGVNPCLIQLVLNLSSQFSWSLCLFFLLTLSFYNKGVCQRPNVDNKIGFSFFLLKTISQSVDSEFIMRIAGEKKREKSAGISNLGVFERLFGQDIQDLHAYC